MQTSKPANLLKALAVLAALTNASVKGEDAPDFVGDFQAADIPASLEFATEIPATSEVVVALTTQPLLPNWVGFVEPDDDACYRQTYISTNCSVGFQYDNIAGCRADCPLSYPVKCGGECIQQNDNCILEIIGGLQVVTNAALKAATLGVFGELSTASANVQQGVKCGQKLFAVVGSMVSYAESLRTNFPNSTAETVISLLNNSNLATKELPTAVSVCLGLDVPTDFLNIVSKVAEVVDKILIAVVEQGKLLLSFDTFMTFVNAVGAGEAVTKDASASLMNFILKGQTCGTELQSVLNKVSRAVEVFKEADVTSSASTIREVLSNSALFLVEIPTVTNNCIKNKTSGAYTMRDQIRKTISMITNDLINIADDAAGDPIAVTNYIAKVADMGLDLIALFDPLGIAKMFGEIVKPICGPTAFMGEIDDGSLADALALTAEGEAFAGSHGNWTNAGDGIVNIVFESTDTEEVTVVIYSAGETIDKVDVGKGQTVTWSSTVAKLQNKAMYFDRWRPGFIGIAGSGGGSLVMWIPSSSAGGHVELVAKIKVS